MTAQADSPSADTAGENLHDDMILLRVLPRDGDPLKVTASFEESPCSIRVGMRERLDGHSCVTVK